VSKKLQPLSLNFLINISTQAFLWLYLGLLITSLEEDR